MKLVQSIQIFGDSVMKGVQLDAAKGRYYTPKVSGVELFAEEFPFSIRNNAKFGCTIDKGYRQLEKSLERGLDCDTVLLEYGGNDCDYNWQEVAADPEKEHLPHTPLKLFEETYRKMLRLLRDHKVLPVMMNLPPIDAEKYLAWICRDGLNRENILAWLGDAQMIYRFQELYSQTAEKLARDTGTLLVDVRSAFLDKHNFKELICEDGIHPSEDGHRLIRDTFREFAEQYFSGKMPVSLFLQN